MSAAKEYRTTLQIDADRADGDLYSLSSKLDGMSARHAEEAFKKAADIVASARALVRKHMHAHDRATTYDVPATNRAQGE